MKMMSRKPTVLASDLIHECVDPDTYRQSVIHTSSNVLAHFRNV